MSPRVVVVGAGLAGLAATHRLRARAVEVIVLEAAARPGGRAAGEEIAGIHFDGGAHVASAGDHALLGFLAQAGADAWLPLRPVTVLQVRRGVADLIEPAGTLEVARIRGVRLHEALRLRRLERLRVRFREILDPASPECASRLDDRSIADFARLYFGRSVLERWIEPLSTAWTGDVAEEASRVLFLLTVLRRRFAWTGTLRGGLDALCAALAAPLDVRCATRVEAVRPASGGRLAVHARQAGGTLTFEADAVVIATPAHEVERLARELLAPAERDVLGAARSGAALVLAAAFDAPLVPVATRILVPRVEGGPVETLLVEPDAGSSPEPRGLAALVARSDWSAAHFDAPDDVVTKELLDALERLYPGAASRLLASRLFRHALARPRFPVGRYRAIEKLQRVGADRRAAGRRLYVAGDHVVEATLEGAVVSGLRAADAALADLGICHQSDSTATVTPSLPASGSPASKRTT